jgi:hypothetical protein
MAMKLARLLCLGLAAASLQGCIIVDGDDDDDVVLVDPATYVTIDAGAVLSTTLGEGAGFFVEYQPGGYWTFWTSCDTLLAGTRCYWDAQILGDSTLELTFDEGLEGNDFIERYADNALRFYAITEEDSDLIEVAAEPGALLEVDLLLDGLVAPDYLVWQGNGYVQHGASGSPVVFQPDGP